MRATPIRILVVDDSPSMRAAIAGILTSDPRFEVAAEAGSGQEALAKASGTEIDLVTLDVQMPGMSGLQVLEGLLAARAVPALMVSALTQRDAATTLAALELGAVDYVAKPDGATRTSADFARDLLHKARVAAGADVRRILEVRRRRRPSVKPVDDPAPALPLPPLAAPLKERCIAIGISTGGPPALARLFESLAPPLPPIMVAQHMPEKFTGPFASRLNSLSRLEIREASTPGRLQPNTVLIAPGGRHLRVVRGRLGAVARVADDPPVSGHRPSVDVLMTSVAAAFPEACLAVIMTGMGCDGVAGCAAVRNAGGYVLGQDQETSDVYGMNKAAYRAGHVHRQFALEDLPALIGHWAREGACERLAAAGGNR
jgi:two-component system chemotaxis response regulator CheB